MPNLTNSNDFQISFTRLQLMSTIIFAVILAVGSSVIPILKTIKLPIKEIILNNHVQNIKNRMIMPIIACILFLASILVPRLLKTNFFSFVLSNVALSTILISLLLFIPSATSVLAKGLTRVKFLKNETKLGIRNVEGSKSLLNNIKLIAISLAGLIFIMTISTSIWKNIGDLYTEQFKYDIRMTYRYADANFANELSHVDGVDGVTNVLEINHIDIVNKPYHINTVYGIDDINFLNYHNMKVTGDSVQAVKEINEGRNILITELLKSKLGVNLGDQLILNIDGIERTYIVTGFVDTSFSKGDIVFVSSQNLKEDTGLKYYSETYVKVKANATIDTVYDRIKRKFLKDILVIRTLKEIEDINKAPLSSTFNIIISYSLLAVLIGIVGIINNLIVSFIERKRYLAIYRSVGMSKKSMGKMLFSEEMFIGVFGALFGLMGALAMISVMPYMLSFIYGEVRAVYSISTFIFIVGATIGILVLTAIVPTRKSTKMSIIESIKYE